MKCEAEWRLGAEPIQPALARPASQDTSDETTLSWLEDQDDVTGRGIQNADRAIGPISEPKVTILHNGRLRHP